MTCPECGSALPVGTHHLRLYCGEKCYNRAKNRRAKQKQLLRLPSSPLPAAAPAPSPPGRVDRTDRPGSSTGDKDPEKREKAVQLLAEGHTLASTGRKVGLSANTIRAIVDGIRFSGESLLSRVHAPDEALASLEDFGYFRERYFGRVVTPWQKDAADRLIELKAERAKHFVVLNVFPGSGKTSLFAHDLICWFAVRNRSLRTLVGSRTLRQATMYTNRLRRSFSRVGPGPVDEEDVLNGMATYPTGCLARDFGRFQPLGTEEMWTADQFVLYQDGESISEKEASFTAFGMDTGFLGGRYDIVVWDDLIDGKSMRTVEAREQLIRLYTEEIESRVDPGGLLVLQGQRMRTDDLYRYCLDMRVDVDEETGDEGRPKYHHIVYRAHNEDLCGGADTHGPGAPAWPEGCLLDPKRLPWREIMAIRGQRTEKWAVLYQQEDVDPDKVLVQRIWVDGGKDPLTGEMHPGCWDHDRGLAEIPAGLIAPYLSVASCDPSPERFWGTEWWAVERSTERRYLIDLDRRPMEAPEFLDWNYAENRFTGLMEDWQTRSVRLGAPITHWIVEINAARFLYQHDYVKRWQALHRVALIPHTTQTNRNDKDFGVQTIGPHYRFGRVRLPGKTKIDGGSAPGRQAAMRLVDEVTRFPDGSTDDLVLAHWFMEWNLPRITPPKAEPSKAQRPSWMGTSRPPNWLSR